MIEQVRFKAKRTAALLATLVTVGAAAAVAAPAAHADKIDTWKPGTWSQPCGSYCLYYSQGLYGGCYKDSVDVYDLNYVIFENCGEGSAGVGQRVGNNAASMGNKDTDCNVTAWYHAGWTAPSYTYENWLDPGYSGNLTSVMRNNERSINVNSCR